MKTYQEFLMESVHDKNPDYMKDLEGHVIVRAKNSLGKYELFLVKGQNGVDNKAASAKVNGLGFKSTGSWNAAMTFAVSPRNLKAIKSGQYTKV